MFNFLKIKKKENFDNDYTFKPLLNIESSLRNIVFEKIEKEADISVILKKINITKEDFYYIIDLINKHKTETISIYGFDFSIMTLLNNFNKDIFDECKGCLISSCCKVACEKLNVYLRKDKEE